MRPFWFGRHLGLVVGLLSMTAIGCDAESARSASRSFPPMAPAEKLAMPDAAAVNAKAIDASEAPPQEGTKAKESAAAGRKIIYTGYIDLVTEDLNALETKLRQLIAAQGAYIADSDRTGSAGSNLRGSWKVRVPVDGYDPFVRGVVALGELVSLKANSQDVSEEYFDLDARQAAKKVEEERLLKHLTESTGKLDEILAVERELSRVRTEIERMQGRLRALANLTSLATVTISASEIKGYVPPQAPTFGTRIARTFSDSLDSVREFGEGVAIAFVAIVPWLPLIALGLAILYWIGRRLIARVSTVSLIDVPPPPGGRS
jgi:Domain of unknown function (DUF4349)